jgi:ribosomal protein S18 acetylase RimI-like enzyme
MHEIAAVAGLFQEYAASLGVDLSYQGFDAELAALPGAYAPPGGTLLVAATSEGPFLGCVAVRPLTAPGECEMKRLYVRPAARGTGAGVALARAAIETATNAGYQAMRLDTLGSMTSAQALYRRLGFETTPPYYKSPIAGTIFMRKVLRAV